MRGHCESSTSHPHILDGFAIFRVVYTGEIIRSGFEGKVA